LDIVLIPFIFSAGATSHINPAKPPIPAKPHFTR